MGSLASLKRGAPPAVREAEDGSYPSFQSFYMAKVGEVASMRT